MRNHPRLYSQFTLWLMVLLFVACVHAIPIEDDVVINTATLDTTPTAPENALASGGSPTPLSTNVFDYSLPMVNTTGAPFATPSITINHSSISVEQVARVEEVVTAFFIQGNVGYAAMGTELVILDLEEGADLNQRGSIRLPFAIQDIKVVGDYAYLALGESGLWIIDVSNISMPKRRGNYSVPDFSFALDFYRGHVYLATQNRGLWIIDVSAPTTPVKVNSFEFNTQIRDVVLVDGIGYIATTAWNGESFVGNSGVYMINVSDPEAIDEIDFFDIKDAPAKKLYIEGGYLYVLTGWDMVPGIDNQLRIVDINQMGTMLEIGNIVLGNFVISTAVVRDGYAYVTIQSCDYMRSDKCGSWLTIVDVSDLNALVELSGPGCNDCGWSGLAQDIALLRDKVYIAAGDAGLLVYKVSELDTLEK